MEQLLVRAADLYARVLDTPQGEPGSTYLSQRSISAEAVKRWGLGYAPDGWSFLLDKARQEGVDLGLAQQAGLIVKANDSDRLYDRFRDRVMFPIHDVRGRVIGFGARCLDGSEPKYLNSPQTPLFDKSRCLYGLFQAKQAISQRRQVVIVEGYTDVIMAHQHGVENVVATLGTALTRQHIDLLRRFADGAVLVFDSDTAGAKASDRSLEIFIEREFPVRVATLPSGADPCDYCLQNGGEAFEERLEEARSLFVYKISLAAGANDASPHERAEAIDDILRLVELIPGSVERRIQLDEVVRHTTEALDIDEHALRLRFKQLSTRNRRPARPAVEPGEPARDVPPSDEAQLVGLALADAASLERLAVELKPEELTHDGLRRIYECILDAYRASGKVEDSQIVNAVPELGALIVDLGETSRRTGNFEANLEGALECRRRRMIEGEKKTIRTRMSEAARNGDDDLLRELGRRQKELQLMHSELGRQA